MWISHKTIDLYTITALFPVLVSLCMMLLKIHQRSIFQLLILVRVAWSWSQAMQSSGLGFQFITGHTLIHHGQFTVTSYLNYVSLDFGSKPEFPEATWWNLNPRAGRYEAVVSHHVTLKDRMFYLTYIIQSDLCSDLFVEGLCSSLSKIPFIQWLSEIGEFIIHHWKALPTKQLCDVGSARIGEIHTDTGILKRTALFRTPLAHILKPPPYNYPWETCDSFIEGMNALANAQATQRPPPYCLRQLSFR